MVKLLLLFIAIIEISLCNLTVSKKSGLNEWRLLRFVTDASEAVLYVVMILLPGIDLSFRFRLFCVALVIRFVFSYIFYIFGKKDAAQKKKTSGKVFSAVSSIIVLALCLIPAFVFADYKGLESTGKYEVGEKEAILVDENRIESFENDGSKREVPVYFYYPVADEKNDVMTEGEKYPVVFFSHGAFGYSKSNYSTYRELASNGYIVISMEHPYHSFFTKDTNGKTVTVNPEFISNAMVINEEGITEEEIFEITKPWIDLRIADADFVIDSVKLASSSKELPGCFVTEDKDSIENILNHADIDKMGFMGHSLGGATAATIGRNRTDIGAVIDLDGTMIGEMTGVKDGKEIVREGKYTTPILSFDNEEHYTERKACAERNETYTNNVVLSQAEEGFNTYIAGAGHMNYTDLPLFSPFLASSLGTGNVDAEKCIIKTNEIVLQFFDCYLKGQETFTVEEGYTL